ncbi:hypothetical protein Agub_g2922 [Astrephomene gubernaculifera]|uniref:Fe2OG dioxygenase domain-containing protein n=1 Tax=Astrephomene gubernaculifera TaxID=47775 RepID=A0AAD3HIR7_9CHLO|nr:hypothetical protein Agub_g2922 [Astrephomene gubernaculifera]
MWAQKGFHGSRLSSQPAPKSQGLLPTHYRKTKRIFWNCHGIPYAGSFLVEATTKPARDSHEAESVKHPHDVTATSAASMLPKEQSQHTALTPRQRRLAQQQRKWREQEEQQQKQKKQKPPKQQQQQQQGYHQRPETTPAAAAPAPLLPPTSSTTSSGKRRQRPSPATPPSVSAPASRANPPSVALAPAAAAEQLAASAGPVKLSSFLVNPQRKSGDGPEAPNPRPTASSPSQPPPHSKLQHAGVSSNRQQVTPVEPVQPSPPWCAPVQLQGRQGQRGQQQGQGQEPLPALFAAAGLPLSRDSSSLLDLKSLSGPQLVALARAWMRDLAEWKSAPPPSSSPSPSCSSPSSSSTPSVSPSSLPPASSPSSTSGPSASPSVPRSSSSSGTGAAVALPNAAAERLALLTAAVTSHMTHGSLGQQELADLVWWVAQYDRAHALQTLYPALGLPFHVIPGVFPELKLEDFMAEVELRRDVIYLEDGSRAVEESRLTGWQSDIGATFRYSGKEMQPQGGGGFTPAIRKVRDALQQLTGIPYDSVLVNYYADGKCGMRYHVDPLYDRWTPESAVVSLGDTRTFVFRAIEDFSCRWQYRVGNGDVVRMFGDCQERLQHCVRVERRAEDAGPRMSLVFKERLRDAEGRYLLP